MNESPRKLFVFDTLLFRGVAMNLLRGTNQGVWGTEVPSGVQGQNMETLENTNGTVTN